jgi:nucleoid-associated protein YgaU
LVPPGVQQTHEQNIDPIVLPTSTEPRPAEESASVSAVGQGERISHAVHASTLSEATEVDGKRSILVRYGDTLENLALQHLGSRNALNLLIEANPQITDINKIFPGQKIYLSDRDKPSVRPLSAARVASRPSTAYPSDTVRNDASNAVEATRTAGDK